MTVEETLQYMADFYSILYPTRKAALNQLFCVIGNGYEWENGELVEKTDEKMNRYKLIKPIKRAMFKDEDVWHETYPFNWYPLSKKYSYLFNYPDDIKPDWLDAINECKQLLIKSGVDIENCGD